jgi:hypothetical protein
VSSTRSVVLYVCVSLSLSVCFPQPASEQRVATLVTQQVITTLTGGSSLGNAHTTPLVPNLLRTPPSATTAAAAAAAAAADVGLSLVPPRRLPAMNGGEGGGGDGSGGSEARMDQLEGKVNRLTDDVSEIKLLLEKLVETNDPAESSETTQTQVLGHAPSSPSP